ncbi:MAG: SpoIIE family protein phosphatase [Bacteroidia bacterium]
MQVVSVSTDDSTEAGLDKINTTKWKYHKGDSAQWAKPDYNDAAWDSVKTRLNLDDLPKDYFTNIAWFRLSVNIDTVLVNKPIAFSITHGGASEIYLNGKLMNTFGKVCAVDSCEERVDPKSQPFAVSFTKCKDNVIAIRYSNTKAQEYDEKYEENIAGFSFEIRSINAAIASSNGANKLVLIICMPLVGFFIALAILHLLIYLFYRKQPANLHYCIFAFILSIVFLMSTIAVISRSPDFTVKTNYYFTYCIPILFLSLLAMIYALFNFKYALYFKICIALVLLFIILNSFHFDLFMEAGQIYIMVLISIICFDCGYRVVSAIKKKKDGAWIIASGVLISLSLLGIFFATALLNNGVHINGNDFLDILITVMAVLTILSIPLSMSIYLARDFAKTNKNLSVQLEQVQILSAKAIEQEQEKQKILNEQNMLLEHQVAERTFELAEKNKEMTDSIRYAQRIQKALMSSKNLLDKNLPEYFVFFNPKDIVSGDFYWASILSNNQFAVVTADSTGHGVPGAFMSLLNISCLNEAVNERRLTDASDILNHARKKIIQSLAEDGTADGGKDGMDCSITVYDFKNNIMQYAAANNPVWIIRNALAFSEAKRHNNNELNKELLEFRGDKMPVGKHDRDNISFTAHSIQLQTGDIVYTLTDGFPDQFGGIKGKKFKYKPLQDLLLSISDLPMERQKEKLTTEFINWKGNLEQVDDVLIIGVRV